MVTHLSTNRARHTVTLLKQPTIVPLDQATKHTYSFSFCILQETLISMPPPMWWRETLCFQSVHASLCASVCPCVSPKQTLVTRYLTYLLMEFDQTFTNNGLWGNDECTSNAGIKRSKVKVMVESNKSQNALFAS